LTQDKFAALQEKFYEQQIKTNEQLGKVAEELARIATLLADTRQEQADHEVRLRDVESKANKFPAALAGSILAAIAAIYSAYAKFTGKA
jgi:hypothetical protein